MNRLAKPLIILAAIYLGNIFLSRAFDVYGYWPWFDIPMHLVGGAATAYLAIEIQKTTLTPKQGRGLPFWYRALFVIGFVMLVAVAWEWHEFVLDRLHEGQSGWMVMQPSSADTMKDLLMGFLGGLTAIVALLRREG